MLGITEDMMSTGGLTADYRRVAELTNKVAAVLENGKSVEVTTLLEPIYQ